MSELLLPGQNIDCFNGWSMLELNHIRFETWSFSLGKKPGIWMWSRYIHPSLAEFWQAIVEMIKQ